VSTRYERIKMQRRLQRQIRLVVEERRIALAQAQDRRAEVETTVELPGRAIGRVPVDTL
jgi:hypothetical protein